jgi:hypothetical protein
MAQMYKVFQVFSGAISRFPLYLLWRPEASGPPQKDAVTIGARASSIYQIYFLNFAP